MSIKELSEVLTGVLEQDPDAKVVVAKKKKRGGYTVFPQVIEAKPCHIQLIGNTVTIVYED